MAWHSLWQSSFSFLCISRNSKEIKTVAKLLGGLYQWVLLQSTYWRLMWSHGQWLIVKGERGRYCWRKLIWKLCYFVRQVLDSGNACDFAASQLWFCLQVKKGEDFPLSNQASLKRECCFWTFAFFPICFWRVHSQWSAPASVQMWFLLQRGALVTSWF